MGGLPGKSSLCSLASNHFPQPSVSLVSETPSMPYRRAWAPGGKTEPDRAVRSSRGGQLSCPGPRVPPRPPKPLTQMPPHPPNRALGTLPGPSCPRVSVLFWGRWWSLGGSSSLRWKGAFCPLYPGPHRAGWSLLKGMGPTVPLPTSVPEWWCLVKPLLCPVNLSWAVSFKCRFYCYSGLAKPTNQELIAIEKIAGYSLFQEVGAGRARGGGAWGSTWVGQEAKVSGSCGPVPSLWFPGPSLWFPGRNR